MHARRGVPGLAAVALTVLLAACGGGTGGLESLFPFWVLTDVLVADVDGDGRADIVTLAQLSTSLSHSEGRLLVRLQTAPGVFAPAHTYLVGIYPWKLALGDVDGDGATDIVVADVGSTSSSAGRAVWMLRQDAGNRGHFLAPQLLMADQQGDPYDVAVADVNGDGVPDIVIAAPMPPGRGATVLVQDPARRGTFLAPALLALPGDAVNIAVADVDGDGRDDLVFRMYLSQTNHVSSTALGVAYRQPGGALGPIVSLSPQAGINTDLLGVTDMNVDGVPDVVEFFTPSSTDFSAKLTVLRQSRPAGSFSVVDTSLAGVKGLDGGAVADLDADGRPDFVAVGTYSVGSGCCIHLEHALNILLQDASGAFTLASRVATPFSPHRVAAGDLNGDGLNDLAVLGAGNQVFVMLQSATAKGTFLSPRLLN